MRIFVTGGSGVLGRVTIPLLIADGHDVVAPARQELDLFDPAAVTARVAGAEGVYHLASRIPPLDRRLDAAAWAENDRLRRDASRILVDAAMANAATLFVVPTVAFIYPPSAGPVDESTPVAGVPAELHSALSAEREAARFSAAGERGVVLRLGLLYGPGTNTKGPDFRLGCTLHVEDAAFALVAALGLPAGVYNVADPGGRVSVSRFSKATGWHPRRR